MQQWVNYVGMSYIQQQREGRIVDSAWDVLLTMKGRLGSKGGVEYGCGASYGSWVCRLH
jgi:hypothetical protein